MKEVININGQIDSMYGTGRGDEKGTHKELLGYWQCSFLDLGGSYISVHLNC